MKKILAIGKMSIKWKKGYTITTEIPIASVVIHWINGGYVVEINGKVIFRDIPYIDDAKSKAVEKLKELLLQSLEMLK